jgi:hypothetical protein
MRDAGHMVFRMVSLLFSLASAHAIYWFFSALNGTDAMQPYVTGTISIGFVALGFFVTRGLAHRILEKRSIWSYLLVGLLYVFVEVVCNFGEAAARYPDMHWINGLRGWQLSAFGFLAPVVLSIIPLFNLALACIDVDLMREKTMRMAGMAGSAAGNVLGRGPVALPGSLAKSPQGQSTAANGVYPTTTLPTAQYPHLPSPAAGSGGNQGSGLSGVGNNLQNFFNQARASKQQRQSMPPVAAVNGVQPKP